MAYIKTRESENIRKQLWVPYNNNGDWKSLAKSAGIKKRSSRR